MYCVHRYGRIPLTSVQIKGENVGIRRVTMSLNLEVRQNLWAMGIRAINRFTGVKHGNPADSQVEKYGSPLPVYYTLFN